MKKSLIALAALATVATAAQAQSSVEVYGVMDLGYSSVTKVSPGAARVSGLQNGGLSTSRLGFRGTEDLGGGLKAKFNLEAEILADTGAQPSTPEALFARASWVGLESAQYGSVQLGRMNHFTYDQAIAGDAFGGNNFGGFVAANNGYYARIENAVTYKTPVINGYQGRIDYTFGTTSSTEAANSGSKSDNLGLSVNYANGPLKLAAGTHTTKTKNALVAASRWVCADPAADVTAISTSASACGTGLRTLSAGATAVTAANDETKAVVNVVAGQYVIGGATLFALYGNRKVETEAKCFGSIS